MSFLSRCALSHFPEMKKEFEDASGHYGTDEGYNFAKFLFYWSFSGAAVTM